MSRFNSNLVPLCVLLVTGCGGTPPVTQLPERTNLYVGKTPIYAILDKRGDGQWTFTELREDALVVDEGYVVKLNDLSPGFDIRLAKCEAKPYRDQDKCSPLNPFREKDVGVVDKIVSGGLAVTTGGKLSGIRASYTTKFDDTTFNTAVDQALLNTGLDENRSALISGLEAFTSDRASHRLEIDRLKKRHWKKYAGSAKTEVRITPRVSGLSEYYTQDLAFDELVSIRTNTPKARTDEAADDVSSILPCPASRCMAMLNTAREKMRQQHQKTMAGLEQQLTSNTSSYQIDCSKSAHGGYHFELKCPEQFVRSGDDGQALPVTVIIHARDFEQVFPIFQAADEVLALETQGDRLSLRNLTEHYLEIQSLSLYYNSKIHTVSNLQSELDLAPYASASHPLSRFSSTAIDVEARYTHMTPDKASRTSLTFGIAAKYSVRDRNAIATLYGKHVYNLQCAIENRIRPGACSHDLDSVKPETDAESELETLSSPDSSSAKTREE